MSRPRLFKTLKIALSAVCSIVCVLLVVLWIRSYTWYDRWEIASSALPQCQAVSKLGRMKLAIFPDDHSDQLWTQRLTLPLQEELQLPKFLELQPEFSALGITFRRELSAGWSVSLPYWFNVVLLATLATVPWIHWRFSLRTLLIATTLIAAILGLLVYAARS